MTVVDEIKARLDIVDIVSDTVNLKKSGRSYTGFCPFHTNTKTPSFVVFPDTQTWRCFGACADGGDVVVAPANFVIETQTGDACGVGIELHSFSARQVVAQVLWERHFHSGNQIDDHSHLLSLGRVRWSKHDAD